MARFQHNRRSPFAMIESLEQRVLLSAVMPAADSPAKPTSSAPSIELAWVALHELGHSLGLDHRDDPASIMDPYYNAHYDFTTFASDPAVTEFQGIYTSANVQDELTPWKDALDGNDDGHLTITYSRVKDGAVMDSGGKSNTDSIFDLAAKNLVVAALNEWASVSNGTISFEPFNGTDGQEAAIYRFGVSGLAQHDPRFGDIRIATHKFDGPGKVLAHTYFPPPNGGTAAGDAHFDSSEKWVLTNDFGTLTAPAPTLATATAVAAQSPIAHATATPTPPTPPTAVLPPKALAAIKAINIINTVTLSNASTPPTITLTPATSSNRLHPALG